MKRMSPNLFLAFIAGIIAIATVVAIAHHGGVSLGYGPGSPIETSTGLTLPQGGFSLILRDEQVNIGNFTGLSRRIRRPSTSLPLGLGYGFTPYLSAFLYIPAWSRCRTHWGNVRRGRCERMFYLGGNYDPARGFRLNTQEDTAVSLETSKTTYFSLNVAASAPTGESHNHDKFGRNSREGCSLAFGAHRQRWVHRYETSIRAGIDLFR